MLLLLLLLLLRLRLQSQGCQLAIPLRKLCLQLQLHLPSCLLFLHLLEGLQGTGQLLGLGVEPPPPLLLQRPLLCSLRLQPCHVLRMLLASSSQLLLPALLRLLQCKKTKLSTTSELAVG